MKKFILTFFAACLVTALSATTVNYTALPDSIFPNPERGFLRQTTRHANQKNAVQSRIYELNNLAAESGTLILVLYYLDEFIAKPTLPDSILNAFVADLAVLRNRGMKAIVRIAYAENRDGETCHDAPLSIIKQHLAQFKSRWAANADVIFCFQAGFVGQYGEWYYTENFGNHVPTMTADCKALLDTALKAIPEDRTLLLRRPMFKQEYLDGVALTESEAYTGTKKARLGHFNDAFLYHADNMGTYSDTATQKPFIAQETLYVPIGGETDITKADQAASEASHDSTIAEMSRMHWTFIKSTYSETVTDMWRNNGTFDELNCKLGYRFQLNNGQYSDTVVYGNNLSVNMNIQNLGFAPLYNRRPAYIVLKNNQHSYQLRLSADPRTWKPNNVISNVNENITIADSIAKGKYNLYLYLPDAYASIAADSRYAVRFANEGVWNSETGMNSLLATVFITDGQGSVELPATLNKANVDSYSDDMTWYGAGNEYFDFGPTDAPNLDRWAEWKVNLKYPGNYIVSEVWASYTSEKYGVLSHQWKLLLYSTDSDSISSYLTTRHKNEGSYTYSDKWNLTGIQAGVYTLRVTNIYSWAQPKLKSLTLSYDGEIPSGIEKETEEVETDGQMYDILGRPVDESYKGIVIMRGKKQLRL